MSDADTRGETWRERSSYLMIAALERVARALPTRTGRVVFMGLGTVAHRLLPRVRAVVAANQARVLGLDVLDPLVARATHEAFRSYARYWFDTFHITRWSNERVQATVEIHGFEHLREPVEHGRGVIAVLPHLGNWDVAGRAVAARGLTVVAVAEELRPERLFDLFVRMRERLGLRVVGHAGGSVGRELAAALAGGEVVALVADRDLNGRGIEVEMFGAPRRLPGGPAILALSTGAPIVTADVYQTREGWSVTFRPLPDVARTGDRRTDVTAITREVARAFERAISAAPEEWHLFQPAWES
ncbi:MAG: phosphatidylinositol mannoside acyltransferase [Actinomycetota bacterium]